MTYTTLTTIGSGMTLPVGTQISFRLERDTWDNGNRITASPVHTYVDSYGHFAIDLWPSGDLKYICTVHSTGYEQFASSLSSNSPVLWSDFIQG